MLTTKINIDFYSHTLTTINAKQHDTFTRHINVTCTNQGRKVTLDRNNMSAYVALHKSNSDDEFEHVEILDNGTVNIDLTEYMLSVPGKMYFDIIIFGKGGLSVDDITKVSSMEDLNTYVLSTMPCCLNVVENAVSYEKLEGEKNYSGLLYAISLAENMEIYIHEQEEIRQKSESERVDAEIARTEAENIRDTNETSRIYSEDLRMKQEYARIDAESEREKTFDNSVKECTDATNNANAASKQIRIDADSAIADCENATNSANEAATKANESSNKCEGLINKEMDVFKDALHVGKENGVATLDENGQVPMNQLGNIHKVYCGTEEPTNDIGNDGDIYMMIIS